MKRVRTGQPVNTHNPLRGVTEAVESKGRTRKLVPSEPELSQPGVSVATVATVRSQGSRELHRSQGHLLAQHGARLAGAFSDYAADFEGRDIGPEPGLFITPSISWPFDARHKVGADRVFEALIALAA